MEQEAREILELLGLAGVVVYLGAYAALQAGLIRGTGYHYAGLNIIAASLVLASLASSFNLSSMLIQVSWICISLFGMARFYIKTRGLHFTGEERAFLERHFPKLPDLSARKLLDAGDWKRLPAGTPIATEGEALSRLIYLHRGAARVSVAGRHVADLGEGDLVGEITVLQGGPATADVVLSGAARIFEITSGALEAVLRNDVDARMQVEACLVQDLSRKLEVANRRQDA